jgi:hypothetical protein
VFCKFVAASEIESVCQCHKMHGVFPVGHPMLPDVTEFPAVKRARELPTPLSVQTMQVIDDHQKNGLADSPPFGEEFLYGGSLSWRRLTTRRNSFG